MYFNAPVLVVLATLGTTILAAPAKVGKREPTNVTCTPNNQGVNVCCDSFGGCELQNGTVF